MVVSDSLKSHVWTVDKRDLIMAQLDDLFPTLVLACTVYSGVTALFSFLMVLGVKCESRCLMIPFLILSMIDIIVAGAAGVWWWLPSSSSTRYLVLSALWCT